MNRVIIEFGSNINPEDNIEKAKKIISESFTILNESSILKTKPVGVNDQDDYLNCAVMIETEKTIEEIKFVLNEMEFKLGRKKENDKYASRTIDLDIIVWNNKVIHQDFYDRYYIQTNVKEIMPEIKCYTP